MIIRIIAYQFSLLKRQINGDPSKHLKETHYHERTPFVSLLDCAIASGQQLSMFQPPIARSQQLMLIEPEWE